MLYKLDKNGHIINEAELKKIQPYYKKILEEINQLYFCKLGSNLISIYIRGSVSTGRAKPYISDIDSVAIIKKKLTRKDRLWFNRAAKKLEKKFSKVSLIELTIITPRELFESKEYKNLKIYLKTQSVCLEGTDLVSKIPRIKPGKKLAQYLYADLPREIKILKNIFSGKFKNYKYLQQKRSTEFWCIWMCRTLLRAGLGLVMIKKPIYSQDLKTCYNVFIHEYPECEKEAKQLVKWSVKPLNDKKQLFIFLDDYSKKFLDIWQTAIK
jgi:predicted nucleotidyltransferase